VGEGKKLFPLTPFVAFVVFARHHFFFIRARWTRWAVPPSFPAQ
jgi:hypothetical protein